MQKSDLISRLAVIFSGYHTAASKDPMEMRIVGESYWQSLNTLPDDSLIEALTNFQLGAAPGQNPNFPPSAPAIAVEARRIMAHKAHMQQLALPPPPHDEVPAEERARVAPRFKELVSRRMAAQEEYRSEAEIARRQRLREMDARHRARNPDSRPMRERLRLSDLGLVGISSSS